MSFGTSSFGLSPFGGGTLGGTTSPTREGVTAAKVRRIKDGDYVRSETSTLNNLDYAPDPIAQEIAFRLGTILGTFAGAPQIGNDAVRVHVFNDFSQAQVQAKVFAALQPMVDRGSIEQLAVVPDPQVQDGIAINFFRVTYVATGKVEV